MTTITTTINNFLITCDLVCDYIPFVNTLSNSITLIAKPLLSKLDSTTISANRYFQHIKEKNSDRSFLLLIPFLGNIYIIYYAFFSKPTLLEKIKACKPEKVPELIRNLWPHYLSDREIILTAVKINGVALFYATSEHKADEEIVLEAVKNNRLTLQYASNALTNDRNFILKAIKLNPMSLINASNLFRRDEELRLEALKQLAGEATDSNNELKSYEEILLEAVKKDPRALNFATDEFKNNSEVALAVAMNHSFSLIYLDNKFRNDQEFALKAIKQHSDALIDVDNNLKMDLEFCATAIIKNISALESYFINIKSGCGHSNIDELLYEAWKTTSDKVEFLRSLKSYSQDPQTLYHQSQLESDDLDRYDKLLKKTAQNALANPNLKKLWSVSFKFK